MKTIAKSFLALVAVIGLLAMTAPATLACDGDSYTKGFAKGFNRGLHKGWVKKRPHLVPWEMKKEFREDYKGWTEEEQVEYREARKEMREERKLAFEEFVGMTRDEIREAHKDGATLGEILEDQGKTREATGEFLTEQGEERIEFLDEWHDLDEEQEQTLRDRLADFVERFLDRLFGEAETTEDSIEA